MQLTAANTDAEVDRLIRALEALTARGELRAAAADDPAGAGRMNAARVLSRAGVAGSAWIVYLAIGALLCLLYVTVPPFRGSGPLMNLLGLTPVVAILVGVRMHRPASPAPWRWFAVGFALFWFGDLYTYSYPLLLDGDVPFPSPGDGAYLLVYPVLIAGLVLLVRRRRSRADRGRRHRRPDPHRRPVAALLGRADRALRPRRHAVARRQVGVGRLPARRRAAARRGHPARARRRAPRARVLPRQLEHRAAAGDRLRLRRPHPARRLRPPAVARPRLARLLPAVGRGRPASVDGAHRAARAAARESVLTRFRLALLSCASLIAPAFEFVHDLRRGDFDMAVVTAGSAVLFGLVVLRMAGLVRQQERSLERERTLSSAGAALVGATGRDEIQAVAVDSARGLAGPGSIALVLTGDARRAFLVEEEGTVVRLDATRRARVGLPAGAERALPLAMTPRRGEPALLVVCGATLVRPVRAGRAARAGHPDRAGARQRGAERGGPPPAQRGALRLARPALHRPHHRARARRPRRLPEPLDRARARLRAGEHRGRAVHRPRRAGRPRRGSCTWSRAPSRAPSTPRRPSSARSSTRTAACAQFEILMTNLLDDEHVGGIVLNSRDVSERKRLRGAAHAPGVPRRGHRARQPRAVRRARAPRDRPLAPRGARLRRALPRPRRLQGDQRQPRPRRRRRGPHRGRPAAGLERARRRHRGALRRRRVRRAARGGREHPGGGRHRRADARGALPAAARRPPRDRPALQPRHLRARRRRHRRRRRDDPRRRRRHVHRQARRQGRATACSSRAMHEGVLERLELRTDLQRAHHRRPARAALPAGRPARRRARRGRRGAAALEPPRARHGPARPVHPDRRGDRPHRADRPLGPARGLPPRHARARRRCRATRRPWPSTCRSSRSTRATSWPTSSDALADAGPGPAAPHARDHRDRAHGRRRAGRPAPARAQGARRPARPRRLRDGLLVAELPEQASRSTSSRWTAPS